MSAEETTLVSEEAITIENPKPVELPKETKKPRRPRRTKEEMAAARAVKNDVKSVKTDKSDKAPTDLDAAAVIGAALQGIHALLAELVAPECALTQSQAQLEGKAIADVLEMYDMSVLGKYAPWVTLVTCTIAVEAPTMIAIAHKAKAKRVHHVKPTEPVVDISAYQTQTKGESL